MNRFSANGNFIKRLLIICAVITLIVLSVLAAGYVIDALMIIFAAVMLAVFLRGLADLVNERLHISECKAVLVVSFALLLILAGGIYLLAPARCRSNRGFARRLDGFGENGRRDAVEIQLESGDCQPTAERGRSHRLSQHDEFLVERRRFFSTTAGMFANFLIAVLLAIYLAAEPQLYIGGLIKLFPVAARPRARQVIGEIGETLRWWLIGKMGSMLCIGVLTCIGLWIIGVPLALTLGLIAGLLSFIPNFGPIMSAIPAVLFGFIESPATALYVIGLYLGVQFIESYLVTPWIERRTVSLPPALTITFQLLLSVLIGGLGLVLATPILAVIMVLVQMLYIEDVLGDVNTDVNEKDAAENPKTDKSVNNIELENND